MLLSIALILLLGFLFGEICKRIKLPGLIGMLLAGILLGPYVLNLLDSSILSVSSEIRKIALIVILTRAGLSLNLSKLKQMGRSAFMMCFVPASFELLGIILIAPKILNISVLDACIMGTVLAAVSPAVVVPRMVKLMDEKYGTDKGIPELVLAGASVDDVYVIVLFSAFLNLAQGEEIAIEQFINIPISIVLGILAGLFCGKILRKCFNIFSIDNTMKCIITLSISFLLTALEDNLNTSVTFSSLIAILFMGVSLQKCTKQEVDSLSSHYNKLWTVFEIFLFVLVGASVNVNYLGQAGMKVVFVLAGGLVFRMVGVCVCLFKTSLNRKEKLFTMFAYIPKATVQAAIGAVPLSLHLNCGEIVLIIAVLAILFTAPLGAFLMDFSYKKLLQKES